MSEGSWERKAGRIEVARFFFFSSYYEISSLKEEPNKNYPADKQSGNTNSTQPMATAEGVAICKSYDCRLPV